MERHNHYRDDNVARTGDPAMDRRTAIVVTRRVENTTCGEVRVAAALTSAA